MWVRLCLKYEIRVPPEKLVRFCVLANEANASGSRPESRIRSTMELYSLINNYPAIESFEKMVAVFPEATKYYRADGLDLKFVLVIVAPEKKPFPFTSFFGIELLFETIADPARAKAIKDIYEFDYFDLINLTGKHDGFSFERLFSNNQSLSGERATVDKIKKHWQNL